jgi:hypothetical protein
MLYPSYASSLGLRAGSLDLLPYRPFGSWGDLLKSLGYEASTLWQTNIAIENDHL